VTLHSRVQCPDSTHTRHTVKPYIYRSGGRAGAGPRQGAIARDATRPAILRARYVDRGSFTSPVNYTGKLTGKPPPRASASRSRGRLPGAPVPQKRGFEGQKAWRAAPPDPFERRACARLVDLKAALLAEARARGPDARGPRMRSPQLARCSRAGDQLRVDRWASMAQRSRTWYMDMDMEHGTQR
jgi:hypothetical protein